MFQNNAKQSSGAYIGAGIGVASYGALGHVPPPRLPASYFGDHKNEKKIKRTNTENVQKQRDFCAIFINFWPIFVIFLAHSFPQGVL